MKAKYRKFDLRRHKYCFWLRIIQTVDDGGGVKDISKAITNWKRRESKERDYEHNQRRRLSRHKRGLDCRN